MNRGAVGRDAALAMILGSAFGGVRGAAPIREGEAWARLGSPSIGISRASSGAKIRRRPLPNTRRGSEWWRTWERGLDGSRARYNRRYGR